MLGADLMIGTNDRPLKQRPDALYGVRVNIAAYPFFGAMVDRFVRRIRVRDAAIAGMIVGHEPLGGWFRGFRDELFQQLSAGFFTTVLDADSDISAPLDRAKNHGLVV